jgi:hypothetical protein
MEDMYGSVAMWVDMAAVPFSPYLRNLALSVAAEKMGEKMRAEIGRGGNHTPTQIKSQNSLPLDLLLQ